MGLATHSGLLQEGYDCLCCSALCSLPGSVSYTEAEKASILQVHLRPSCIFVLHVDPASSLRLMTSLAA